MTVATQTYDDTILANLDGVLTPQAAEAILQLGFSMHQQQRMQTLAAKARSGELAEVEREELESFERVSSLLGILQSRARMTVKNAAT